ncbi:effector protein NopP [Bradyrhizobium sp. C9]|uniref:effector protein NopP n=1 Tax=Bradyrhizobium sp. C9 TaxID=142585 RepID=UPI0024C02DAE|nr:effector protein NopP [Bradyrhizobium sp. C9]
MLASASSMEVESEIPLEGNPDSKKQQAPSQLAVSFAWLLWRGSMRLKSIRNPLALGVRILMYGRIGGYYEPVTWASHDEHADERDFEGRFANMHLSAAEPTSSSAAPTYSLVTKPPIEPIDKDTFRREAKIFQNDDEIMRIAENPREYSRFVSTRAKNVREAAEDYGSTRDSEEARYYSYQLGNKTVALLRTEGGYSMNEFHDDRWRELFPGREHITSVVDLQLAHPLVENAGDILLEYQLRRDAREGEQPLLKWYPLNEESKARAAKLGFVEVDDCNMVLDPTQHPDKWTTNSAGEWQRANKPERYLAKVDDGERRNTHVASSGYAYEDDFM